MEVIVHGESVPIADGVFELLLGNSVASAYVNYSRAMERGQIRLEDLVNLSRTAQVPHSLFFAPHRTVRAQVALQEEKLLSGIGKETFSINSRDIVHMRDVQLIVKDLIRKQELLKKHDPTLVRNRVVGAIRKQGSSEREEALHLMSIPDWEPEELVAIKNKDRALEHLIKKLEAQQILVSRSVQNFMPQRLQGTKFSGLTIKDSKVPYIFLRRGEPGDPQEPTGRMIFTLTLLSVLVGKGIFSPVTYDGHIYGADPGREYRITEEILMPRHILEGAGLSSLESIREVADLLKVTPSAITVRARHIGQLSSAVARGHLDALEAERRNAEKKRASQPHPATGVRTYAGGELVARMLGVLDSGQITPREFCRTVCLNHILPSDIDTLRGALR